MKRDIAEKRLISFKDVAADIINAALFDGEIVVQASDLKQVLGQVYIQDEEGDYRERIRDALFAVMQGQEIVAYIGIENQSGVDNIMPLRVMGMDYGTYLRQVEAYVEQNRKEKYFAYTRTLHNEQKLKPVYTIILNYRENWDGPNNLRDLIDQGQEDRWTELAGHYPIHVINLVGNKGFYKRLHSDFRIVAHYLAVKGDEKEREKLIQEQLQGIVHPEAFLYMMKLVTGDKRFREIEHALQMQKRKEGRITMCELFEDSINIGLKRGIAAFIEDKREDHVPDQKIIERLMKHFNLDEGKAKEYLEQHQTAS